MPDDTLHAIDCAAFNVLGSAVSWDSTGQFTYDEVNIQFDTLVFTDNDVHLTITDTSLEILKSKWYLAKQQFAGRRIMDGRWLIRVKF